MKIIKPSVEYVSDRDINAYDKIKEIGSICYQSEPKKTGEEFVQMLLNKGHWSVFEHVTMYFEMNYECFSSLMQYFNSLILDRKSNLDTLKYINVSGFNDINLAYVSGSVRAFLELFLNLSGDKVNNPVLGKMMLLLYNKMPEIFFEPGDYATSDSPGGINDIHLVSGHYLGEKLHEVGEDTKAMEHITHTLIFVCDRGVTHELVRHRPVAYSMESTRYCSYSDQLVVIEPCFFPRDSWNYTTWKLQCEEAEKSYIQMLSEGCSPQQARTVLPHSIKAQIAVTATEKEWKHILNLRLYGKTGNPHPQMKEVMSLAEPILHKESNYRI